MSQGKIEINGVDDHEEFRLTDVSNLPDIDHCVSPVKSVESANKSKLFFLLVLVTTFLSYQPFTTTRRYLCTSSGSSVYPSYLLLNSNFDKMPNQVAPRPLFWSFHLSPPRSLSPPTFLYQRSAFCIFAALTIKPFHASIECSSICIFLIPTFPSFLRKTEILLLSNNIYDYHYVSQGKVEINGVDDNEEFRMTDVSI